MSLSPLQFVNTQTQPHPAIGELLVTLPRFAAPGRFHPWSVGPSDAGHLVCKRDRDNLERSPCEKLDELGILLRVMLGAPQNGVRTDDQSTLAWYVA